MKTILFNTEIVKAILDGRKTQFRVPIKQKLIQPIDSKDSTKKTYLDSYNNTDKWYWWTQDGRQCLEQCITADYKVGNIVSIKEQYEMCMSDSSVDELFERKTNISLKITNAKVERLQEISDKDIKKEGFDDDPRIVNYEIEGSMTAPYVKKEEFIRFWNSIAKDGYKFEDNPFVFVYEFEVQQ